MPIAARLAEALSLPGNPVAAVDAARDKYATRAIMQHAGLPTPANALIEKAGDLAAAAAAVGFPAVIKPIAGAGSMGVVRVDSAEALATVYAKVVRDLGRAVVTSGALVYAPESGTDEADASTKAFDAVLMVEAYLDGPEVDVDVVLCEGKAEYAEVTDNWPTIEPFFQEVGANCPSQLSRSQQDELIKLSVDATLALGFTCGVFHVRAHARPGGGGGVEEGPPRAAAAPRQMGPGRVTGPGLRGTHAGPARCLARHPPSRALAEPDPRARAPSTAQVESKYTSQGPRLIEVNCRMGGMQACARETERGDVFVFK